MWWRSEDAFELIPVGVLPRPHRLADARHAVTQPNVAGLSAGIDVRLVSFGDRWVATVSNGRRLETGLGRRARSALAAAIGSLEPRSAAALLADPALFAVSWKIRQAG